MNTLLIDSGHTRSVQPHWDTKDIRKWRRVSILPLVAAVVLSAGLLSVPLE